MANTKVTGDLIASSTIATGNIADNAVTSDKISGITTAHITEGSNLYYTDARADARITAATTSDLTEGTNLYYTNARADARVNLQTGANLSLSNKSTSDLSEGTNLYYTDARADARAALLVDSAPSTLDTLNELAAALGDDPNFATTTANSIGLKAPLASPTFTGTVGISATIPRLNFTDLQQDDWAIINDNGEFKFQCTSGSGVALLLNTSNNATFAGEVSLKSRLNLQRSSSGATTLIQFKNEIGSDRAHIDFGGTNEELSFFAGAGSSEHMRITSSGDVQLVGNKYLYANPSAGSTTIGAGFQLDAVNNIMKLWTNDVERMRIDSSGKILLNNSTYNFIGTNTSDGSNTQRIYIGAGNDATATQGGLISVYGNEQASTSEQGQVSLIAGRKSTGNIRFWTGEASSVERMRIDSSGNIMMGKTSQSGNAALTVKSTAGGNTGIILVEGDTTNDGWGMYAVTANEYRITRFTNGSYSDKFVITSAGNVGIKWSAPDGYASLTVNGDSSLPILGLRSGSGKSRLAFYEGGTGRFYLDTLNGSDGLAFIDGNGATERMRITSGGDITVSGGDLFLNSGTNYNDKGVVYISNERTAIISDIVNSTANGDTSLDFQTRKGGARASAMFIDEFRNVGIGTDSPAQKLTIDGTVSGAYVRISNAGSGDVSSGYMIYNGSNLDFNVYTNPTFGNTTLLTREDLAIRAGGTERMRIKSGGNTLIGMTSEQNAGRLQIESGASENGGILDVAGGGWYRYYTRVCRNATSVNQAGYWHIKTNIVANSNTMFLAKFYGYIYGSAQIVDLTHAGYAYSGTSTVINQATKNNGTEPNASSAVYVSANGSKVTFRIAFGTGSNFSTYFAGVTMDIAFLNPAGQGIDFEIEAQSFSTSTTVY